MPFAAQVDSSIAGGVILGTGYERVVFGDFICSVIGDDVASHGFSPHDSAKMAKGSARVFAGDRPVCRVDDPASCTHVVANGFDRVDILE